MRSVSNKHEEKFIFLKQQDNQTSQKITETWKNDKHVTPFFEFSKQWALIQSP